MKTIAARVLRKTRLYHPVRNWLVRRRHIRELSAWEANGRPAPPPHLVKQQALRAHARKYGLRVLVETGTLYGDMVDAMRHEFDRIYTIELSRELYRDAKERFRTARNVEVVWGDSGRELGRITRTLDQPALFWLDGHYSGGVTARAERDTPVFEELRHIFAAPVAGHVIIIDDARCFGRDRDYPTIGELREFVRANAPDLAMTVQDDSIRLTPNVFSVR